MRRGPKPIGAAPMRTAVRVDSAQAGALADLARARGVSVATVVREALASYLSANRPVSAADMGDGSSVKPTQEGRI